MRSFVVFVVVLIACIGCGGTPAMPKPSAPSWIASALGRAPDAVIVLRVDKASNDPVYAPIFRTNEPHGDVMAAIAAIRSVEIWMAYDSKELVDASIVMVIHGTPRFNALLADSDLWRRRSREGTSRVLPGGGIAWTLPSSTGPGTVAVVQYPSGVSVMGTQRAATAILDAASRGAAEPRPTDYAPDMLFVAQGSKPIGLKEDVAGPGAEGIESFSAAIGEGGRGDIVGSATYDTEEHADLAFKLSQMMLRAMGQKYAAKCRALEGLALHVDRKGRTVEMRVSNIPQVLVAAKQTCKTDETANGPAAAPEVPRNTQPSVPAGAYPGATSPPAPSSKKEPESCAVARSVKKNYQPSAAKYLRQLEDQCRAAGGKP